MTVIQQSGRTSDFIRRFAELNERYYRTRMKNVRIDALLLRALMDLISALILVGVLATFGWQSLGGVVEVGVLYAFINYLGRVVELAERARLATRVARLEPVICVKG